MLILGKIHKALWERKAGFKEKSYASGVENHKVDDAEGKIDDGRKLIKFLLK